MGKTLVRKARQLRQRQTESEAKLWARLRNRRFLGYKFYRQFPIGPYIADFCCRSKKLVVEVDGGGHARPAQQTKDRQRDASLTLEGYEVIRIWSNEIFENIDGVMEGIRRVLEA